MQLWFWAAVTGAILAGLSNFCFKIAAKREYNSEAFSLIGGATSVVFAGCGLLLFRPESVQTPWLVIITIGAGGIATIGGILKVYALRHIDTTIFFPLFKLFSPLLAVIAGLVFFAEQFSRAEWIGIIAGLLVPLILITKIENSRQQNLLAGIILMAITAATSATAATLNKLVIDEGMSELEVLWYASWGILVGSVGILMMRNRTLASLSNIKRHFSKGMLWYAFLRSFLICFSMLFVLYAYGNGGALGVVQTIHSLYILIPIILAILFYKEHWNVQKMAAVLLSLLALTFLH